MSKHSRTFICHRCGFAETFTADKRYALVMSFEQSGWDYEPTPDGNGTIETCPACVGSAKKARTIYDEAHA